MVRIRSGIQFFWLTGEQEGRRDLFIFDRTNSIFAKHNLDSAENFTDIFKNDKY